MPDARETATTEATAAEATVPPEPPVIENAAADDDPVDLGDDPSSDSSVVAEKPGHPPASAPLQRRRVIAAAAVVALFALAGSALIWVFGGGEARHAVTVPVEPPGVLVALPPMLFDLQPSKTRPHFLRLSLSLEVAHADRQKVQDAEARIVDAIKTVLRDYRYEDLIGKTGTERIRSDILIVAKRAAAPAQVRRVLFSEFLLD